jgi:hypothetical protein
MLVLEFFKAIFKSKSESEKLEKFIISRDPQSEYEVETLTRIYYRQQTTQWFNNC